MNDFLKLIKSIFWLALFGALYQELRRPPEERSWHGRVLGVVPYDFRVPTVDRIRDSYWNPASDRMFADTVFGVGWSVNLPVAFRRLRGGASQYLAASRRRGADGKPAALPRSGERR